MSNKVIPFTRKESPEPKKNTQILNKLSQSNIVLMASVFAVLGVVTYLNMFILGDINQDTLKNGRSLASTGYVNRNTIWERQVAKALATQRLKGAIITGSQPENLDRIVANWGKGYRVLTNKDATMLESIRLIELSDQRQQTKKLSKSPVRIERIIRKFVESQDNRSLLPNFNSVVFSKINLSQSSFKEFKDKFVRRRSVTLRNFKDPVAQVEFIYSPKNIIEINVKSLD